MAGTMADDIREALSEHSDDVGEQGGGEQQQIETLAPDNEGTYTPEGEQQQQPAQQPAPAPDGRVRDPATGKFAPRTPAVTPPTAAPAPASKTANEQQPSPALGSEQQPAPTMRAPVSWTPAAREVWGKLDPLAQAEVHRREREITETLRTTAEARNFYTQVGQVLQPHMQAITAAQATPVQAIQSLFQIEASLRVGTAVEKANTISRLVKQYGVDINTLDEALSAIMKGGGGGPAPGALPPELRQELDSRLAPITEFVNGMRQSQQSQETAAMAALEEDTLGFMNDPANEFAWDLKDEMADIVELASRRGQKISLQAAYQRAILLHPTISGIIQSRKQAQNGEQETAAARRARLAAASITEDGAPGRAGEDSGADDLRSVIVTAANLAQRRA